MPPATLSQPRTDVRLTFPDGTVISAPTGTSLEDYGRAWTKAAPGRELITGFIVDNAVQPLSTVLDDDEAVIPLLLSDSEGMRIYRRSVVLLVAAAARRLFPHISISMDHSVTANGNYGIVEGGPALTRDEVCQLEAEAHALAQADLPIEQWELPVAEARELFASLGYPSTVRLLDTYGGPTVTVHSIDGTPGFVVGHLLPRTGLLTRFRLKRLDDGFLLLFPVPEDLSEFPADTNFPKLTAEFRRAAQWLRQVGVPDAGTLNQAIDDGHIREIVLIAEALHERRIGQIAQAIGDRPEARLVFVAGPSSSGKTTFSKRLGIQLAASGIASYAVQMDDYFVDRDRTPRAEDGSYDFEAFGAVDQALFQEHMLRLMAGETVTMPRYDFPTGTSVTGATVQLPRDTVLIVEGIHGLNPALMPDAPVKAIFRIYVSCLTQLRLDHHNYIRTSDARLLRRMVRDARTRGYTAEGTILRWQSVRRGERKWVFPYQEKADMMFNTALPYETAVIRPLAEPLLLHYDHNSPAAAEATRLLRFLRFFRPAPAEIVPDNSLFREFIGGSIMEQVQLVTRH